MSVNRAISLSTLVAWLAFVCASPALRAADPSGDSEEVSTLLSEAKTQANQLRTDASDMESFTLSSLAWETHANKLMEIKDHVNTLSKTITVKPRSSDC